MAASSHLSVTFTHLEHTPPRPAESGSGPYGCTLRFALILFALTEITLHLSPPNTHKHTHTNIHTLLPHPGRVRRKWRDVWSRVHSRNSVWKHNTTRLAAHTHIHHENVSVLVGLQFSACVAPTSCSCRSTSCASHSALFIQLPHIVTDPTVNPPDRVEVNKETG